MQKVIGYPKLKCWLVAQSRNNGQKFTPKQVNSEFKGGDLVMGRPLIVDINTLAKYLSISKNTIYSWVNQRKIPYHKVGSLLRFDINAVDEWLKVHKKEANPKGEA